MSPQHLRAVALAHRRLLSVLGCRCPVIRWVYDSWQGILIFHHDDGCTFGAAVPGDSRFN